VHLPPDDPNEPVHRRDAEAQAAVEAEVERIAALPSITERMQAYSELARALKEDGEAMPLGAEERIVYALRTAGDPAPAPDAVDREARALAARSTPRSAAPGAIILAVMLPFLLAIAREFAMAKEGGLFASPGSRATGIGLAVACAGILARLPRRATTMVGLAWLVVGAFVAGMVGLAVARGVIGFQGLVGRRDPRGVPTFPRPVLP
jgi:hypothetical protein